MKKLLLPQACASLPPALPASPLIAIASPVGAMPSLPPSIRDAARSLNPSIRLSQPAPRVDGAYVLDEDRVDAFALTPKGSGLAHLLPSGGWDEPAWASILE